MNKQVDMGAFIAPKSDQLNSDDLISGPISVTITAVSANEGSPEQPISVSFKGDEGKPFKPCKSMRRVMVHVWGADASKYVGRSMTLYRDPKVQFGGMQVGGIRISHMSHIDEKMTMALTASRAKRAPFTVLPLENAPRSQSSDFSGQLAELKTLAQPGNLDALGAKWQEIGADARKALAAELAALKAACNAPAAEDVPFDEPPATGLSLADQIADRPGEAVDETTAEITDVHPGTAIADAIIAEINKPETNAIMDVAAILNRSTLDLASMLDEDAVRVEIAADKRRAEIREAQAKAKEPAQ